MIDLEITVGMLVRVALLVFGEEHETYKSINYMFDDAFMKTVTTNVLVVTFGWDGFIVKWNGKMSSVHYICEKSQSMQIAILCVTMSF